MTGHGYHYKSTTASTNHRGKMRMNIGQQHQPRWKAARRGNILHFQFGRRIKVDHFLLATRTKAIEIAFLQIARLNSNEYLHTTFYQS